MKQPYDETTTTTMIIPPPSSPPSSFLCPLTKSIMTDPVIDPEGNTYERRAITRWLDLEDVSPLSRNPLSMADLVPNGAVKNAIEKARLEEEEKLPKQSSSSSQPSSCDPENSNDDLLLLLTEKRSTSRLLLQMQQELELLKRQHKEELMHHQQQQHHQHPQKQQLNSNKVRPDPPDSHTTTIPDSAATPLRNKSHHHLCSSKTLNHPLKTTSATTATKATKATISSSSSQSRSNNDKQPPSQRKCSTATSCSSSHRKVHSGSTTNYNKYACAIISAALDNDIPLPQPQPRPQPQQSSAAVATTKKPPSSVLQRTKTATSKSATTTTTTTAPAQRNNSSPSSPTLQNSTDEKSASLSANSSRSGGGGIIIRHNGWNVPIGVHQVTCAPPGLLVTVDVHRRSAAVKRIQSSNGKSGSNNSNTTNNNRKSPMPPSTMQDLIIPNGSFVDVIMTEIHGGRVRGKIQWEEEEVEAQAKESATTTTTTLRIATKQHNNENDGDESTKAKTKRKIPFMIGSKRNKNDNNTTKKDPSSSMSKDSTAPIIVTTHNYTGWISLCWSNEECISASSSSNNNNNNGGLVDRKCTSNSTKKQHSNTSTAVSSSFPPDAAIVASTTDEDSGPWTKPIPLGVYRIDFNSGLPIRESPERDSALLRMLERGQYAEVVETTVKNERVRARCITLSDTNKSRSGWISLLNVKTGSRGASLVPPGAYVAVSETGCLVTEGASVESKVRTRLSRGMCVDVCATRLEGNNVVRGLLASGGYVTLMTGRCKNEESDLMPVPLGTYQILHQDGLPVNTGMESHTDTITKLKVNARVKVVETSVDNGRVRGRICSAANENARKKEINGWISLFEFNTSCRWAKFVFSK